MGLGLVGDIGLGSVREDDLAAVSHERALRWVLVTGLVRVRARATASVRIRTEG